MKDSSARFVALLETVRPRGGRLIEGFSVKLQRRARLFSRSSFAQWIRLEADPSVIAFCERPARVGPGPDTRLIDFWVHGADGEAMLLIDAREDVPSQLHGLQVRVVGDAELAAASVWIGNWSRMLPVINATRTLLPPSILRICGHPCSGGNVPRAPGARTVLRQSVAGARRHLRAAS
jgi:hypothetical protein